jgi:omega-6 fatty acid desaturase (delta-12 desaturase)
MGKGGEQKKMAGKVDEANFKLNHMATEELRKWATAYGVKGESREILLRDLEGYADGIMDPLRPKNLPLEPPTFTLATIKAAIPDHCFKRSLFKSLGYLFVDLSIISFFFYLINMFWNMENVSVPIKCIVWPIYWYAQGTVMTGVWVLAHECGHQSFSDSEFANNVVGTICHSALLVPYHNWRITHGRHHANTGSVENDEVFAPTTRKGWGSQLLRKTPLANAWGIFIMLTIGWIPGYLVFNVTGPEKYHGKNANHFSPTAVFFRPDEYWLIVQSNVAFFAAVGALVWSIYNFGKNMLVFLPPS